MSGPAKFVSICVAGAHSDLHALDESGQVWKFSFDQQNGWYWVALDSRRAQVQAQPVQQAPQPQPGQVSFVPAGPSAGFAPPGAATVPPTSPGLQGAPTPTLSGPGAVHTRVSTPAGIIDSSVVPVQRGPVGQ